jgi:hypothetical protein
MDEETKVVIIGLAVLVPLVLACLIIIGVTTVRFIRSEEAVDVLATGRGRGDAGRKAHRVSDAGLSSI